MAKADECVNREQHPEEKDLGAEEHPGAEIRRAALLACVVELLRDGETLIHSRVPALNRRKALR